MTFDELFAEVKAALPKMEGWCSPEKAEKMIRLITDEKLKTLVEIGTFGGSSLIPQAMALKNNGVGMIYGIDPWTNGDALEEMKSEENRQWWGKLDMQYIYRHCCKNVSTYGLSEYVTLLVGKAEDMVSRFADGSLDMLHIDGNHSEALSYLDATLYLPKLRAGGICCFDDIWWMDGTDDATTRRAILHLSDHCDRVELVGDCMILRKR